MPDSGHSRETSKQSATSECNPSTQQRVERALLDCVYDRQRLAMAVQMIGTLIAYPFAIHTSIRHLNLWTASVLAYTVVGFYTQWIYRGKPHSDKQLSHWRLIFAVQCLVAGAVWSFVPMLNIVSADTSTTAILITYMFGVSAVSLGVLSAQRWAMIIFVSAVLAPLVAILVIDGAQDQTYIAAAIAVSLIAYIAVGNDMHNNLQQQLEAQFALEDALVQAREAKEQAETASKAKGQFLATMSHELRTPMNGVLGMLQLVQETAVNPQQRNYLDKMNGAAQSLLMLLNDVLDFSKIEAGSLRAKMQPFRIDALLHNLSDVLSGNVRRDLVEILFDVDTNVPETLFGDEQLLQQVMVNLAGNALKFTQEGSVLVSLQVVQRRAYSVQLRFAVRDTGIGIAPEHLSVIFEAFAQAESSTTRRFGGTGLGLSISKNLVQLMGGTLMVESALGVGSTFWFELDMEIAEADIPPAGKQMAKAPSPATPPPYTSPAKHSPRLQGVRILLAEDNLLNQQIACELLELEGATVHAVTNGQEAIDALTGLAAEAKPAPDLVLMDMHMPVLDGLDTTRRIRQIAHLRTLPILAMTANAMVQDQQACLDAGMNGHIGKPYKIEALVAAIQSQLRISS